MHVRVCVHVHDNVCACLYVCVYACMNKAAGAGGRNHSS